MDVSGKHSYCTVATFSKLLNEISNTMQISHQLISTYLINLHILFSILHIPFLLLILRYFFPFYVNYNHFQKLCQELFQELHDM